MSLEIERKFYVIGDHWQSQYSSIHRLCDAVAPFGQGKVRIRMDEDFASITFKGRRSGQVRLEFEYPVPRSEAEEMIRTLSPSRIRRKTRYQVPVAGRIWSVDVHESPFRGLITTEVELDYESQPLDLPSWVGEEITGKTTDWAFQTMILGSLLPNDGAYISA